MPRFTLIEVDNFPIYEYIIDAFALPIYLQRDSYRHREDMDFASEAEINEAIANWELPESPSIRMIVEYEPIDNYRRQINSLTAKNYFLLDRPIDIYYRALLFVHIDQRGKMYGGMLPLEMLVMLFARVNRFSEQRVQLPIPKAPLTIESEQNTHIPSVSQSVIKAIKKLQARYQDTLNEANSIFQLEAMLAKLNPNAFCLAPSIIMGAKLSINSLTRIAYEIERGSGLTVNYIVALVWTALNDNAQGVLLVEKKEALKRFICNLFEIQSGGNQDEQGNDDGKSGIPICFRGTINKLVDTLNAIHPDVQIIYVSKESASLKLPALVREYAVNFIKNSTEKTIYFNQMKCNKEADHYPIPESVLEAIKEPVKKNFKEEFKIYLSAQDLDGIFSSYIYVNLTENNFKTIETLILCEERIAAFQVHINSLSEYLKTSDLSERNKQKFEKLNNALIDMLDGLLDVIKKRDGVNKDYYMTFKKNFSRLLNENELFSSSTWETLHHQLLILLNRLIAMLSGKKIASISSKTAFFKKKQAMHFSLKDNFEYAIDHLPTVRSLLPSSVTL